MKILSRGSTFEQKKFRGVCVYCQTEFECLGHEGERISDNHISIKCPVCMKKGNAFVVRGNGGKLVPDGYELPWSGIAHQIAQAGDQRDR